jgi:ferredoxin
MAITKIWIEENCTACGVCVDICPEIFEMKDLATVVQGLQYSDYENKIKEAAENCPVEVIRYIE